jgi:hypothetical protein
MRIVVKVVELSIVNSATTRILKSRPLVRKSTTIRIEIRPQLGSEPKELKTRYLN